MEFNYHQAEMIYPHLQYNRQLPVEILIVNWHHKFWLVPSKENQINTSFIGKGSTLFFQSSMT